MTIMRWANGLTWIFWCFFFSFHIIEHEFHCISVAVGNGLNCHMNINMLKSSKSWSHKRHFPLSLFALKTADIRWTLEQICVFRVKFDYDALLPAFTHSLLSLRSQLSYSITLHACTECNEHQLTRSVIAFSFYMLRIVNSKSIYNVSFWNCDRTFVAQCMNLNASELFGRRTVASASNKTVHAIGNVVKRKFCCQFSFSARFGVDKNLAQRA